MTLYYSSIFLYQNILVELQMISLEQTVKTWLPAVIALKTSRAGKDC